MVTSIYKARAFTSTDCAMDEPEALHFFNRFDRFGTATNAVRSRHRYEAII